MSARLVVVGGDAGGMAAATQAKRRRPDLEVIALEKGPWTSYSACGIPYVVGGVVDDLDDLIVRTPQQFAAQGIEARVRHEAVAIDLEARRVEVRDHERDETYTLGFDILHLATGARPLRPSLPGIDDADVYGVQTLEDAGALVARATASGGGSVAVIGGGYIGLEMAEAFVLRGWRVTVIEREPEVMGTLDPDMGALVSEAMRSVGVDVRCGEAVEALEARAAVTPSGRVRADIVILGLGVVPNTGLAEAAGIETGVKGAVVVDRRQATTTEGVWAAGDCCESTHIVSGRRVHVALGTVANRQGRVAGLNIAGHAATFPGVVGTAVTKICRLEVARTGLSEREATALGLDHVAATIDSTTRAGYYPGAGRIRVKLVAERGSGRVLGAQLVGEEGAAKRIDVVATAISAGMDVEAVTALDLSYAPPISPVWDPVQVAARKALDLV